MLGASVMLLLSFSLAGCSNKSVEVPAEAATEESAAAEEKKEVEVQADAAAATEEKKEENSGDASSVPVDFDELLKKYPTIKADVLPDTIDKSIYSK